MTWVGTHLLDPYRPIGRIDAGAPAAEGRQAARSSRSVALDWKWLFIYPEHGIATVNELAAPVDAPIKFQITSSSVMNAFYVPALAGMIYAMPGMETKLHAVINEAGDYDGFSSNYQRRRLLGHALQVPRPRPGRLRRLGEVGEGRRRRARPGRLSRAREAERARRAAAIRLRRPGALRRGRSTAASTRPGCASRT